MMLDILINISIYVKDGFLNVVDFIFFIANYKTKR